MAMMLGGLSAAAIAALRGGSRREAVSIVRTETGVGLQEALAVVEAGLQADSALRLAVTVADARRRRRAMPVLMVALLLIAVAAYVVFG